MAEQYESDPTLNALSGTTDTLAGAVYPDVNADPPWFTAFYKLLRQILKAMRYTTFELQPYKDDATDLTLGVRAGKVYDEAGVLRTFAATTIALTDNATNSIYVTRTANPTLTKSTAGYPTQAATPHVPIATVVTSAGTFAVGAIVDDRGDVLFVPPVPQVLTELQPYDNGTLSLGVRAGKLRNSSGDLLTYAGGTRNMTDDQTNYVYLYDVSGVATLTHSTSAFPDPGVTPHLRIATAVAASGDLTSIVDERAECLWQMLA